MGLWGAGAARSEPSPPATINRGSGREMYTSRRSRPAVQGTGASQGGARCLQTLGDPGQPVCLPPVFLVSSTSVPWSSLPDITTQLSPGENLVGPRTASGLARASRKGDRANGVQPSLARRAVASSFDFFFYSED